MQSLEALSVTEQDTLQYNAEQVLDNFSNRMFNTQLMALRAANPFIPIMMLPNGGFSVQLQPNIPVDINLDPAIQYIFPSGDQVYYLSRNGAAQVPKAPVQGQGEYGTSSFQNPEGCLLFVGEVNQISVISPVVCNFTCGFYTQQ